MPELKHHFRAGKMNKDLDERLVPNGEYRNAENIEISTSESSDVGSVQNVLGNTKKLGKTYDPNTKTVTANWSSNYIDDLTNPKCIGSIVDTQNDKIYWFITSTNVDTIAEYNETEGIISPVIVDKNSILNFSEDFPVTGVNVIEGMLLWTDNQSEPKKIKISSFKSGSTDFNTHTTFNSVAFTENDITVAKLSPLNPPTLTMSSSRRSGVGTGTTPAETKFDFVDTNEEVTAEGENIELTFTNGEPDYKEGDNLVLSYTRPDDNVTFEVKVKIRQFPNGLLNSTGTGVSKVGATFETIPVALPDGNLEWEVLLDEEEILFENKFVRYAYRWKYKDGEYSCYSPFSEVAFIPSNFKYQTKTGFNEALQNNLRSLTVNIPDDRPTDVEQIDILYKESNNNLVYVVDELKENADGTFPSLSYEVKSEIIGSVVEANQLLRPWDNVPKKAKAQEVTANRLIYGNYYQNYDILKQNLPVIQTEVTRSKHIGSTTPDSVAITQAGQPAKSLKSQRTYQIGVVYKDAYGRETPVFSNKNAAKLIGKNHANQVNSLKCKLTNTAPEWATHYKFFVKETSNEYYNLALDRFYEAEDGNIWLSFPSCERNKVGEDSYLILKKRHNSDEFVSDAAKYKVIDIQNEPPEYLTIKPQTVATATCKIKSDASDRPTVGTKTFEVRGPTPEFNDRFAKGFTANASIRIITSGGTTRKYKVESGGPIGEFNGSGNPKEIYRISLLRSFMQEDEDVLAATYLEANDSIKIELFEDKKVNKPEFFGKFFVKIKRDAELNKNIITSFPGLDTEFSVVDTMPIYKEIQNEFKNAKWSVDGKTPKREVESAGWIDNVNGRGLLHPDRFKAQTNFHPSGSTHEFSFYYAGINYGDDWRSEDNMNAICEQTNKDDKIGCEKDKDQNNHGGRAHNKADSLNPFLGKITEKGTVFSFTNVAGEESGKNYEVTDSSIRYEFRVNDSKDRRKTAAMRRKYTIKFKVQGDTDGYSDDFAYANDSGLKGRINQINLKEVNIIPGEEVISTTNPAVWETEPKESIDLDLYNEISGAYPIIRPGMTVSGTGIASSTTIASVTDANTFTLSQNTNAAITSGTITLTDSKGIYSFDVTATASNSSTTVTVSDGQVHGQKQTIDWYNCYSFGNGVESNRLRDDFNAIFIDKGPKVSTVLAEQYKEEHKQNGLIFSGIFNSTSSINRLNQFIQAEPITKDINPYYGSIQKLHGRRSDLLTFCEDQVLKILANKDALFEAGGNQQLTATNRVLGQSIPYAGEYGISKFPQSFVSHANNVFWADKARGVVCTLGANGVFPISSQGMTDWFKDNLAVATNIIGTYNQSKSSYNITLKGTTNYTLSYDPRVAGWVSFKSFIPESGCSLNNKYYTFSDGEMWIHNNETRNNFYGTQYQSGVTVLLNDAPELIKGFKTLNYEGSDARRYTYAGSISGTAIGNETMEELVAEGYTAAQINSLTETATKGWYCNSITTNEATGAIRDFKEKEGKWFNYLKGDTTTLSNLDSEEFSVQGVGQLSSISGDTSVTGHNVIITLAAETGLTLASVASASGNQTWSQNGNVITLFNVTNGTNLDTFDNLNLTFTADTGYSLPSTQTITSQSPTSFVSTGGNPSWNSSTGVLGLEFTSQTISSADKEISLNLANGGVVATYTVSGTFITNEVNTTTASVESTYQSSATASGASSTAMTRTFTAASGHYFKELPTCTVATQDNDPETAYTIATSDTTTTMVVKGESQTITTARAFTITYKHGAENRTGDVLIFGAQAERKWVERTEVVAITGIQADNSSTIPIEGDTRVIAISATTGTTAPTFQLKRTIGTWSEADLDFADSAPKYWDGDAWNLTPTTITWAATTGFTSYRVTETYGIMSTSKRYKYEVIAVNPGLLSSDFDSTTNPVILYQYGDVTLTSFAKDDPAVANAAGTRILNYDVAYDASASGTHKTQSASDTISYGANATPTSGSEKNVLSVSHIIKSREVSPNTADAILVLRDPESSDFTFQQVTGIVGSAVDGSKTVVLQEEIPAIVANMVVTSDEKLVNQPVTVTAVSGKTITLSSGQIIPALSELIFSPPNDWEFDVTNVEITKADVVTAVDGISSGGYPSSPLYGTVTVTADYEIDKYGTVDLTSVLKTNKFLSFWDVSGTGSGSGSVLITLLAATGNISSYGRMTGKIVAVGTTSGTTLSGTIVLRGNWSGNSASDITVGVAATSDMSGFNGSSYSGDTVLSTSQFPGTGNGNDEATINWSIDLNTNVTMSTSLVLGFTISLTETP